MRNLLRQHDVDAENQVKELEELELYMQELISKDTQNNEKMLTIHRENRITFTTR